MGRQDRAQNPHPKINITSPTPPPILISGYSKYPQKTKVGNHSFFPLIICRAVSIYDPNKRSSRRIVIFVFGPYYLQPIVSWQLSALMAHGKRNSSLRKNLNKKRKSGGFLPCYVASWNVRASDLLEKPIDSSSNSIHNRTGISKKL